jgi:hypothetical protein
MLRRASYAMLILPTLFAACGDGGTGGEEPPEGYEELGLGEVDDLKADGNWGAATTCKPIPNLTPLKDPMIVVSLDGLTVHLWDRQGTYDKVFPIGPGAIENGKSLTPVSTNLPGGVYYTRTDKPKGFDGPTPAQAVWSWNHACRMWWTDEQGKQIPVFAGLPFIRLEGPPTTGYALHGPIDSYTQANGGKLRRGYVSHGCIRMEAADVVELYALIQGKKTPVRVQQAVERKNEKAVDIAAKWIGQECSVDADCNFTGGFCHANKLSGRGYCSARCTSTCADRAGYPGTFCVADPDDSTKGMCVPKSVLVDNSCRRYDHFKTKTGVQRFKQATVKADVCLPGSEGWMGDRCLASNDCTTGACAPVDDGMVGVCTQACSRSCPDRANYASTFCVEANDESGLNDGMCVAKCFSNDDCAIGTTCEVEVRNGQPSVSSKVCLPY